MSYDCDIKQSKYDDMDEDDDEDDDDIAMEVIRARFGRQGVSARPDMRDETEFLFEVDDDEDDMAVFENDMELDNDELMDFDLS